MSIDVTSGTGVDLEYHSDAPASGYRDNDVEINPIIGEAGLAAMLKVSATYQTYYDATQVVLDLNPGWVASYVNAAGMLIPLSGAPYDGPYYYTTYASVRPTITKNGQSKAVRVVHRVESSAVEAKLGLAYGDIFTAAGSPVDQQKQKNIAVKWTK